MAVAWTLAGGIFDKMWYDAARGRATGANPMEKSNLTSLEMTHLPGRTKLFSGVWGIENFPLLMSHYKQRLTTIGSIHFSCLLWFCTHAQSRTS